MQRELKKKTSYSIMMLAVTLLFFAVVVCIGLQVHPNKLNLCNLILCEKRYIKSVGMGFIRRRGVYTERERGRERKRGRYIMFAT